MADIGSTLSKYASASELSNLLESDKFGIVSVKSYGAVGDGVTDDTDAIQEAIDSIESQGKGILFFPYTGNGYIISSALSVEFSNLTMIINDNITLTKTTKSSAISIKGTSQNPLTNIKIISHNSCVINGNGSNMIGYTYNLNDSEYKALNVWYVNGLELENIHFDNGLVDSCFIISSKNILINNCKFSNSQHDNGLSILYTLSGISSYDAENPDTWTNAVVRDCYAYDCEDYGMTNFIATNVVFENCLSENCGAGNDVNGNTGGGFSCEGYNQAGWNANTRYLNCKATNCIGRGFYFDSNNIYMDKACEANYTVYVNTGNSARGWGWGVVVLGSRYDVTVHGKFTNNERGGISYYGGGVVASTINGLFIDAIIKDCVDYGISLRGIQYAKVKCNISGINELSGANGGGILIDNSSADFNEGAGTVIIENSHMKDIDRLGIYATQIKEAKVYNYIAEDLGETSINYFTNVDTVELINCSALKGTHTPTNGFYLDSNVTNSRIELSYSDCPVPVFNAATNKRWAASATYNPPSLADGEGVTTTVTLTGAALGDFAVASFSKAQADVIINAWVSATDTVSVRFQNESAGVVDLAEGTLRVKVIKD